MVIMRGFKRRREEAEGIDLDDMEEEEKQEQMAVKRKGEEEEGDVESCTIGPQLHSRESNAPNDPEVGYYS
ncbi:hypothetical protein PoB_005187900 [Plakobranchus ocellatus]|uniref:Uncharacterized protein n=1 Tax=Plakobranchus ocellatus TaxID=259542 RepID=A0AAV4C2N4_9GAST|nr:hypothetical protein PoB_005187900 [Plakobranchus ocellatus]